MLLDQGALAFELGAGGGAVGGPGQCRFGGLQLGAKLGQIAGQSFACFVERGQAGFAFGGQLGGSGLGRAGLAQLGHRRAQDLAGFTLALAGVAGLAFRCFGGLAGSGGGALGGAKLAGDFAQAAALAQLALGRAGGARCSGITVPTPQGSVLADQTLALGQSAGEVRAIGRIFDHADLGQAAGQRLGGSDEISQGRASAGQFGGRAVAGQLAPMERRLVVAGGPQIVAQRGAQRRLVAFGDADPVEDRLGDFLIGVGGQGEQPAFLGAQGGKRFLGRDQRGAGEGVLVPRLRGLGLGVLGALARFIEAGLGEPGFTGAVLRRWLGRGGELAAFFLDGLRAGLQPAPAGVQGFKPFVGAGAQSFGLGGDPGDPGKLGFQSRHRAFGFGHCLVRGSFVILVVAMLVRGRMPGRFLIEPDDRRAGFIDQRALAHDIALGLLEAHLVLIAGLGDLRFFGVERFAGQGQALQLGRGGGFGLAQLGQLVGRLGLPCGARGGLPGKRCDLGLGAGQRGFGGFQLARRRAPAQMQQDCLGAADLPTDIAVALGLAGLALEPLHLTFEGDDDIVEPGQVVLGPAQAQLGLVTARVKPGDPGRLFEQQAALGRLGVDQRADAALADDRRRTRAGRDIGEKKLDVAGPGVDPVDPVVRSLAALDPPCDLDLRSVVVLGRRRALGIVERNDHLGDIARTPLGGAVEDHVVHFAAAHGLGRALAHGPAQRLEQVRLAAAIGPDDAGHPGLDGQLGRIDERFEPRDADFGELDQC